jgi:hypothetical protein
VDELSIREKQLQILALFGTIEYYPDYDYKQLRRMRPIELDPLPQKRRPKHPKK